MIASLPLYPTPISLTEHFSTPRLTQALSRLVLARMNLYRFRSSGYSGKVKLCETSVQYELRRYFTTWKYDISYEDFLPKPVRTKSVPFDSWIVGAIASLAVISSLIRLTSFGMSMPLHVAILLLLAGIPLLCYAWSIRKLNVNSFFTVASGLSVWYSKTGPDSANFESFTETLSGRIADAKSSR